MSLLARSSKKKKVTSSPYSSGPDSPAESPFVPRKRHTSPPEAAIKQGQDEVDIEFFKGSPKPHRWFGEDYTLHRPKNAQNLMALLQQPESKDLLEVPMGEDNPLHSIVCQHRPDKMDVLITFLTHSSVDVINTHGKGGMTALHYAVQANDILSVQVLLAFGADINLVNLHHHTPLDIATFLWLTYERQTKIRTSTNNLEVFNEKTSFPDVSASPIPSPLLQRAGINIVSQTDSSSSWVYVDELLESSSSGESVQDKDEKNLEDSREFTSSVMPIRSADVASEILNDNNDLSYTIQFKCVKMILDLLYSVHAHSGKSLKLQFCNKVPLLSSLSDSEEFQSKINEKINPFLESQDIERSVRISDFIDGRTMFNLYEELEYNINLRFESQNSLSCNTDEAIALAMQQKELIDFKKTGKIGIGFEVNGGSRLLFLDGGGMKGLVLIEVMRQIEAATGRKITELFDWIVGSSIGGILALGLVYAKKSLRELQQVCLKLKEEVFSKPRAGFAFNTNALEKTIIEEFGRDMIMSDIKRPKVLVAAVNKKNSPPQLHFFNNCFNDHFSETPVWKVARYTSAAPMFFKEFENYVDGGVLANNPCDYGLTAIQNFHSKMQMNLPIAVVVSIGTGVYPPEELGRIDAQEFLFFGKHWFNFSDTVKSRTQNLLSLLTNALVESEIVAKNCSTRCQQQNIPFYRFSPHLNSVIGAGETDNEKLIDMMLQTRIQTPQQGLAELTSLFHLVANARRKTSYRQARTLLAGHS